MHLLLLALGVLVTAVGAVMLAFSVPLTDLAGVALFTSGMIAAVGGFILIGVSAAVRSLLVSAGFSGVASHADLAGLERVTEGQWFPAADRSSYLSTPLS